MRELVQSPFRERQPITYAEILDGLEYHYQVVLSGDSLRHIVRNMASIKSVVGTPMDSERVAVEPAAIDAWDEILGERLVGVRGSSCFTWTRLAAPIARTVGR
jgi:hypothetical protein